MGAAGAAFLAKNCFSNGTINPNVYSLNDKISNTNLGGVDNVLPCYGPVCKDGSIPICSSRDYDNKLNILNNSNKTNVTNLETSSDLVPYIDPVERAIISNKLKKDEKTIIGGFLLILGSLFYLELSCKNVDTEGFYTL